MAQIYFGLSNLSVPVGTTFEVGVFLDGQGQSIAAVESLLTMTDGLKLVDIRDGNSVLKLWLERPRDGDTAISFSGITPGGFTGDRGELLTLVFEAEEVGEMRIEAQESKILLNDGQGTSAEIVPAPIGLTVVAEGQIPVYTAPKDTDPPEIFTPILADQEQFGGWVVVFATQDKGSGLAYYEVREGLFGWERAESPYLLEDQKLHSTITVKAVDEAGNERLANLDALNAQPWYVNGIFWGILAIVLATAVALVTTRRLWGKKTKLRVSK